MGEDEVGIELNLGELVTEWKQMTLSLSDDPDTYRVISEMQGSQNAYTTVFSRIELVNYR